MNATTLPLAEPSRAGDRAHLAASASYTDACFLHATTCLALLEHYASPAPSAVMMLALAVVAARKAEDAACTAFEEAEARGDIIEEAAAEKARLSAIRAVELAILRLARAVPRSADDLLVKAMMAIRQYGHPTAADSYLARRTREDILRHNPDLLPLMGLRMPASKEPGR